MEGVCSAVNVVNGRPEALEMARSVEAVLFGAVSCLF